MRRTASILGLLFCAVAVCISAGRATQLRYMSPKQMGNEASVIVRGRVADVHSYWNERGTKIFTEIRVRVEESYKGNAPSEVRVIQLGGEVGHVRMNVAGSLRWRPGEEALLFLEPYDTGMYRVSGFSQGKFVIERDPDTGQIYVKHPPTDGVEIVGTPEDGSGAGDRRPGRMPLNRFINRAIGLE
jgi:hypothetical protein